MIRRLVLVLACSCLLAAHSPAGPPEVGAPDQQPSRIILGFAGNPATSLAVTWRTSGVVSSAAAQIAADSPATIPEGVATTNASSAKVELAGGGSAYHHTARFDGLRPGTRYVYRVGDGTVWSQWVGVRTADATPEPFRFLYLGDAQNGLDDAWPRIVRAACAQAPDARFIVQAGDMVAEGYDDNLWRQWSAGLGPIAASLPSLPVPGNHDAHRPPTAADSGKVLQPSELWRRHFALPGNGPKDLGELATPFYYVDYQGVRFVALDSNPFANSDFVEGMRARMKASVLAWLRGVLSSNPNRWTIVVQHHPVYPVAKGRDYPQLRAALVPIYDEFHVDLVLQGHDHVYARSHALRGGRVAGAGERGTTYLIAVSGTKMYDIDTPHAGLMLKMLAHVPSYQVVAVDGRTLTFESYGANGQRLDGFELKKP